MLAQINRLRRTRDIERVYKRGKFAAAGFLHLKVNFTGLADSRAVVVVGKKISKKAVVRNLIRRRVAARLAGLWATILPGYDIVINIREDLSKTPPTQIEQQLKQALQRAGVLSAKSVKPKADV